MRDLTHNEVQMVGGGHGVCTTENSYWGVTYPYSVGRDLINFYEGLVMFTSHVFERVAKAKDRAK
jgi:hypothetical protein